MDRFQEAAEEMIVYQIRTVWHELSRMYNEIANQADATMAMGFTLLTIHPEYGTPVTKIAPRMGMEPNSLSRLLKSLEEKGLVFRRRDETDKRKVFICLTEAGKEKRAFALDVVVDFNDEILKDLTPEQLESFYKVIGQVKTAIGRMKERMKD